MNETIPCSVCSTPFERPTGVRGRPREMCDPCFTKKYKYKDPNRRRASGVRRTAGWRARNPEEAALVVRRNSWRMAGMDPDEAQAVWDRDQGQCQWPGCDRPPTVHQNHVDHIKRTGAPRAVLCHRHNLMLPDGTTPEELLAGVEYLRRFGF